MAYGELQHWGIKGMKWGIRRYQNKDGSLTPAGKKRYSEDGDAERSITVSTGSSRKKSVSEMSDDELRNAVTRLQLEQRYRELNPKHVSTGRKFVNKVLKDVVIPAATEVSKNALKEAMSSALKSATASAVKKKK